MDDSFKLHKMFTEYERILYTEIIRTAVNKYGISLQSFITNIELPLMRNTLERVSYIDSICTHTVREVKDKLNE